LPQITTCSTLGFCHFSIDIAARQIAKMGFKRIEIAHMGTRCRHYSLGEEDPHRIAELFSELDLTPVATNYSTGWIDDGGRVESLGIPAHARILEPRIQRLLRELSIIGVSLLTIPVGRRTESADRTLQVKEAARVVSRLGDFAADLRIRLALEVPHCWDLHNTLERVEQIFGLMTSPNVGALLDSSHWTLLAYDLEEWRRIVGDRLWHVHLRDAGAQAAADFNLSVPVPQELEKTAGRGECNFSALGAWLDSHGYDGEVSIEFEYRDPEMALSDIQAEYDLGIDFLSRNGWAVPSSVAAQRQVPEHCSHRIELWFPDSNTRSVAELLNSQAPRTCEAIWSALAVPLERLALHGTTSGETIGFYNFTRLEQAGELPLENHKVRTLPGDLLYFYQPAGRLAGMAGVPASWVHPSGEVHEMLLSYGEADLTRAVIAGWRGCNFGRIVENLEGFVGVCRAMRVNGAQKIVIRRLT